MRPWHLGVLALLLFLVAITGCVSHRTIDTQSSVWLWCEEVECPEDLKHALMTNVTQVCSVSDYECEYLARMFSAKLRHAKLYGGKRDG